MTRRIACLLAIAAMLPACGGAPRDADPAARPVGTDTAESAPAVTAAAPAAVDLEQAAADVRRRALAARFVIDELEITDHPRGLRIAVRLRDEQLFDVAAHLAVGRLVRPGERRFAYDLTVRSPAGVAFFRFRGPDGGVEFGLDALSAPVPEDAVPAWLDGPTNLTIVFSGANAGSVTRRLICAPSPHGVHDAERLCRRVLVDRWQLFFPQLYACSGLVVANRVSITGSLGGARVETGYGECASAQRWFDVFEIDADDLGPPPPPPSSTG